MHQQLAMFSNMTGPISAQIVEISIPKTQKNVKER